ncbi:MAG: transketolase [Desulfobacteraceae bacterium]|nr:MAG: transketolase [Desulfobacteraceae bacterium]
MRELMYVQAINEALVQEMTRDEKVFVVGESVQGGSFAATMGLVQQFGPDRVIDTPLCETGVAGAGLGAAMAGYRPVVDFMFADFMYVAADEVFLKAAQWHFLHGGKVDLPVVFLATVGGGMMLCNEHSHVPSAMVLHSPGLKLALPSTPYDAKGLLKTAIRDNNPVCFFWHKMLLGLTGDVPEEDYTIPFGVAEVRKEGSDVTVVATSLMVHHALQAAKELEGKISVEVIDPRTLEPLDLETILKSVKKTGRVVIADEDTERCGFGGELGFQIMENTFDSLEAPIKRVCAANYPIAGGYLEQHILPNPAKIKAAVEQVARF